MSTEMRDGPCSRVGHNLPPCTAALGDLRSHSLEHRNPRGNPVSSGACRLRPPFIEGLRDTKAVTVPSVVWWVGVRASAHHGALIAFLLHRVPAYVVICHPSLQQQ